MTQKITERDLRMPEFRDANIEDLERRPDGKIVRKDRWERAVQSIRFLVGINGREFEIDDVIKAVRALAWDLQGWYAVEHEQPETNDPVRVKLEDGSILSNASYRKVDGNRVWYWHNLPIDAKVVEWKA